MISLAGKLLRLIVFRIYCGFMKKRILYVMHVDWRWIKQRPHFIAEGLADFFDLRVVYLFSKRYLFQNPFKLNVDKKIAITPAFRLPFYQNDVIYKLNKFLMKLYFLLLIKLFKPDFIWITFPQLYDYIPKNHNCKIIYDCMDLATGFEFPENFKSKILKLEKKLIKESSLVFTSSNYLFNMLNDKYQCENKLVLIRNAFGGEICEISPPNKLEAKKIFKIGYVGTVSQWIDFDSIKITLDEIKNIEYHFIGPCESETMLKHSRIKFYGSIDFDEIYNYVKEFDCLIVPFIVDDKIKSADPGKIYGYINYNKPIISVYYEELEYFSKFLCFYSTSKELLELIKSMISKGFTKKYSSQDRDEFLKGNSWDVRISKILNCLFDLK